MKLLFEQTSHVNKASIRGYDDEGDNFKIVVTKEHNGKNIRVEKTIPKSEVPGKHFMNQQSVLIDVCGAIYEKMKEDIANGVVG